MEVLTKVAEVCDKLKTITFFDDKINALQLVSFIIAFCVFFAILRFIKRSIKFVLFVCAVIFLGISLGLISPQKLASSEDVVSDEEKAQQIQAISELTDNVKFDGTSASIKVGEDKWVSTSDIQSFVKLSDGSVVLSVAGQDIKIADENVAQLLDVFKSSNGLDGIVSKMYSVYSDN